MSDEESRLDIVLAQHRLNRSKLAKLAKVSASTVQKWNDALIRGDMSATSWQSCVAALREAGIDPAEVRPGIEVPTEIRIADLIAPIVNIESRETLRLILDVLSLDNHHREIIVAIVKAELARKP